MLSTDIKLPRDQKPVFPDRCVVCLRSSPHSSTIVKSHPIGSRIWNRRVAVTAPACSRCADRLRLRLRLGTVAIVVGAILLAWLVEPRLPASVPMRSLIVSGAVIVGLLPLFALFASRPPAFDNTVYKDSILYEFRNADYGNEFEDLNEGRRHWTSPDREFAQTKQTAR